MKPNLSSPHIRNRDLWFAIAVLALLFIPWLGEMLFYSKGEPREAIVAVSMLSSGDWVLPVSYGGDIPYKPPFLAWLIAAFSWLLNGGTVSEFTSRLPSALAAISLISASWAMVRKYRGASLAWLTLGICATSFEVLRAAVACRVDMVLTACMVCGIYAVYNAVTDKRVWQYFAAILLFTGATLTKGPVGTLLPCLALGIFFLLRGYNFWRILLILTGIALASFILPAMWYYAAWQQGGDSFAQLTFEENIGRLMGRMGYDSHLNPWYYNVITLVAGMLPWTLPALIAFFLRPVRRIVVKTVKDGWKRCREANPFTVLAWCVASVVFVFYCIPASKRSVYLLPCYPFVAYGVAWLLSRRGNDRMLSAYAMTLAVLSILVPAALIVAGFIDGSPVGLLAWYQWIPALLPIVAGAFWLKPGCRKSIRPLRAAIALTYILFLGYNGAFAPAVMNQRSDYDVARQIERIVPAEDEIRTYIAEDSLMRYYTVNYYLNDRLRLAPDSLPGEYWLLTGNVGEDVPADAILLTRRSSDTRRPIYLIR